MVLNLANEYKLQDDVYLFSPTKISKSNTQINSDIRLIRQSMRKNFFCFVFVWYFQVYEIWSQS